ncbi:MAG: baseplate J/gp47 family protein [Candidatus Curtissbacteria bacterium]|nr:baseplate J/gp47 family protein [Candidatus Curtissbacteria bacterium]
MGPLKVLGNLLKRDNSQEENYLSLVLTPDRILASIWKFKEDEIMTLGFGQKNFQSQEVLVHQAAIAIDAAGKQAKVDITKAVFGLSESYLENSTLQDSTTKLLKKLSQELELDPQAFVSIASSVNHLLKSEESITPHAVLIGIFGDFVEVHLLEGDKVVKSTISKSPVNIEKITTLIKNLKEEDKQLPAKIVAYGINESTEIAEKITKNKWKDIFVHEPKIDFLDDAELARAVCYAQAADILGHDPINQAAGAADLAGEKQREDADEVVEEKVQKEPDELGFIEGEDILLSDTRKPTESEPLEEKVDSDKSDASPSEELRPVTRHEEYAVHEQNSQMMQPPQHEQKPRKNPLIFLTNFTHLFHFKMPSGKKAAIIGGVILLFLITASYAAAQTLTKAEVVIKVNGSDFEKEFAATAVEGGSLDAARSQIPAQTVSTEAQASQKGVTTGSKKVGDPAKGEITVFNWTTASKTFAQKTSIITSGGIKFTLDNDVQVASRSAQSPGQSAAKVTAQEVGTAGNIGGGSDVTFPEFDSLSYSAVNSAAFSGGSERQVTVVTQQDMSKLESELIKVLTQKAREDLQAKAAGAKITDDAITTTVKNRNFDKKLDEEASLLNLDLSVEAKAITYSEDDLKNLLAENFKEEAPNNLEIRPENIEINNLQLKAGTNGTQLSGRFKANLTPKFDEGDLKEKIKGKSVKDTRGIIKQLPDVSDVSVNFSPNIPIFSSIPRVKDKITFKIET